MLSKDNFSIIVDGGDCVRLVCQAYVVMRVLPTRQVSRRMLLLVCLGVGVVGGKKAGAVHMKKLIMITLLQCRMTVEAIKKTEDTYKHQVQHQCKFCDRQFKGSTYT